MGNNIIQKKYSLRKFKGIGLASAVIGVLFANTAVYAEVTSDGKNETTIINEGDKIPASVKTTFIDDKNKTKKVTVDAVVGKVNFIPTKANENTGNSDGTDTIKFKTEATVNYLLEDDKSKLQDSKTVEGESGTINTPYDKKGIAYDTDGKDYRESTVEKTGAINENTGREVHLKANNKVYELVRSEVISSDKATYEKTKFNDIEAPVSPEGMHNNLGEINYGKITGKVYLVEETSDGHYGKYVEASNINSDEEAVNAWKNGQATAKDFTKENVTLKEGDTVLVMDRDTYAHGSGKRITNTIKYTREKKRVTEFYDKLEEKVVNQQVGLEATYSFYSSTPQSDFSVKVSGEDQIFGTDDDKVVQGDGTMLMVYYPTSSTIKINDEIVYPGKLDLSHASLKEILKDAQFREHGIINYFEKRAITEEAKKKVQDKKEELENRINNIIKLIKENNVQVGLNQDSIAFLNAKPEILNKIKQYILSGQELVDGFEITLNSNSNDLVEYGNIKDVTRTIERKLSYAYPRDKVSSTSGVEVVNYGSGFMVDKTITTYHKEVDKYTEWKKENPEIETSEDPVYANKGTVSISDDSSNIHVVNESSTIEEEELRKKTVTTKEETNYQIKEIITPVRAYKVMGEGKSIVNHYYQLSTKRSENPIKTENTKVGTVTVQYVSSSGEKLKADEIVELNTPYEITKTYDVFSGTTKVGEEKVVETLKPIYDATPKRFNTIIGDKTGFAYEFEAIAYGSAYERSTIDKPQTIVSYVYRFVSKEDPTPVKKEVKSSVIVKYVDAEGNEIKPEEIVKKDAVIKTIYTYFTKSGDKVISTRERVNYELLPFYSTQDKRLNEITTVDGKKYKYQGVYPVSEKFHNVIAENGVLEEGTTTVVYQYVLEPKKVEWAVSENPPILDVPEFEGGVVSVDPPTLEVPEYTGGVVSNEPPVLEVPEFKGGLASEEPPVLDVPEFNGSVNGDLGDSLTLPQLIITKWVDEYGNTLKPADAKKPSVKGEANEAFEPGTIEGYEFVGTIPVDADGIVTHVFKKKQAYKPDPKPEFKPQPEQTPEPKPEEPKKEEPKTNDVTPLNEGNEEQASVPTKKVEELPQTGTGQEFAIFGVAASSILAGLGLMVPTFKKKEK